MGRLRDAVQTLRGKTDVQIRQHAQLVRIQAEWTGICTHINNVLENLTTLDGRIKKREQRAAKAVPAEPTHAPVPTPKPWKTRKDELRARLKAQVVHPQPPESREPQNPNMEETG